MELPQGLTTAPTVKVAWVVIYVKEKCVSGKDKLKEQAFESLKKDIMRLSSVCDSLVFGLGKLAGLFEEEEEGVEERTEEEAAK